MIIMEESMVKRTDNSKKISLAARAEAKFIAKLWADDEFKESFRKSPAKILRNEGFFVPKGLKIIVLEDGPDTCHFAIPYTPDASVYSHFDTWLTRTAVFARGEVKRQFLLFTPKKR